MPDKRSQERFAVRDTAEVVIRRPPSIHSPEATTRPTARRGIPAASSPQYSSDSTPRHYGAVPTWDSRRLVDAIVISANRGSIRGSGATSRTQAGDRCRRRSRGLGHRRRRARTPRTCRGIGKDTAEDMVRPSRYGPRLRSRLVPHRPRLAREEGCSRRSRYDAWARSICRTVRLGRDDSDDLSTRSLVPLEVYDATDAIGSWSALPARRSRVPLPERRDDSVPGLVVVARTRRSAPRSTSCSARSPSSLSCATNRPNLTT